MICEYWVITTLKPLNFSVRKTIAHALSITARKRPDRMPRSTSSPRNRATLSALSRSRTSA